MLRRFLSLFTLFVTGRWVMSSHVLLQYLFFIFTRIFQQTSGCGFKLYLWLYPPPCDKWNKKKKETKQKHWFEVFLLQFHDFQSHIVNRRFYDYFVSVQSTRTFSTTDLIPIKRVYVSLNKGSNESSVRVNKCYFFLVLRFRVKITSIGGVKNEENRWSVLYSFQRSLTREILKDEKKK